MPSVAAALRHGHGAPPEAGPVQAATPGPGECLVQVTAAPLIPLDLLCATGTSYFGPPALPYVPGVQGVGVVKRGDELPAGSRVWFEHRRGMRPGDGAM